MHSAESVVDPIRSGALGAAASASFGVADDTLAQRLVDEGLRAQEHAGIVFRAGPTGRRAALGGGGPDVWEVVAALRYTSARGDAAVSATAEDMGLSTAQVKSALDYYGSYPDEIGEQVAENERAADDAHAAWKAQRQLLAVTARLLLDEHYPAGIAEPLRAAGHDVIAVVEDAELRAQPDSELPRWAADRGQRIVTE
ncbi:MAG: DUF5615 family PIN-like protein, partial [Jiangellaceae bacterium]